LNCAKPESRKISGDLIEKRCKNNRRQATCRKQSYTEKRFFERLGLSDNPGTQIHHSKQAKKDGMLFYQQGAAQ